MTVFAERMGRLGTEAAFEVLAKAKSLEREGREIIHLEIGEPDFDTPENVKKLGVGCKELSDFLLTKAGVAVLPGTSFGEYGEGYIRLSYANSVENLKKAMERMSEALEAL